MTKQLTITASEEVAKNIGSFLDEAINEKEEYLANWARSDGYTEEDFRTTRESIDQVRGLMNQLSTGLEDLAEPAGAISETMPKGRDAYTPDMVHQPWVIYSAKEAAKVDGQGFWNNGHGWCLEEDANVFPAEWVGHLSLPTSLGQACQWQFINLPLMKQRTEAALCHALRVFCDSQNLPHESADDILAEHNLKPFQSRWLHQFIQQWERATGA